THGKNLRSAAAKEQLAGNQSRGAASISETILVGFLNLTQTFPYDRGINNYSYPTESPTHNLTEFCGIRSNKKSHVRSIDLGDLIMQYQKTKPGLGLWLSIEPSGRRQLNMTTLNAVSDVANSVHADKGCFIKVYKGFVQHNYYHTIAVVALKSPSSSTAEAAENSPIPNVQAAEIELSQPNYDEAQDSQQV
ncbi:hypothetical protein PIB30_046872, partial [Stylosanthes scabra]|nr:hypothetical protein [Stylosanthes scabra]